MKKLITYCLVLLPTILIAQEENTQLPPNKWDVGIEVGNIGKAIPYSNTNILTAFYDQPGFSYLDQSISYGITGNYFIKNNLSLKIKAGISTLNVNANADNATSGPTPVPFYRTVDYDTLLQKRYYIIIGIQQDFILSKVTTLYAGIEIPISIYSSLTQSGPQTNYDTTGAIISIGYSKYTIPGGFSIGLAPFIGIKFNICKHFAIGSEINESLVYQSLGGKATTSFTNTYAHTPPYITWDEAKTSGFSTLGSIISINILFIV